MIRNKPPQFVVFRSLKRDISHKLRDRRIAVHLDHRNLEGYCRLRGTVINLGSLNEDEGDSRIRLRCELCGLETVDFNYYHRRNYQDGTDMLKGENLWGRYPNLMPSLLAGGISACIAIVILIPAFNAEREFQNRLVKADKNRAYTTGEKATCYVDEDNSNSTERVPHNCEVIRKIDVGKYQVKYDKTTIDMRALDMRPKENK